MGGSLLVDNSTLSGNSAAGIGGAIFSDALASVNIQASTLTNNSAELGGGIGAEGQVVIGNTLLAGNDATSTAGSDHGDFFGRFISLGHNLVGMRPAPDTTLQEYVSSNAGTIVVSDAAALPAAPFLLQIGSSEIVRVVAKVANQLTVERGYDGTAAGNHYGGTSVYADGLWGPGELHGSVANPVDPRLATLAYGSGTVKQHKLLSDSPALDAGSTRQLTNYARSAVVIPERFGTEFAGQSLTLAHRFDSASMELYVNEEHLLPKAPFFVLLESELFDVSEVHGNRLVLADRAIRQDRSLVYEKNQKLLLFQDQLGRFRAFSNEIDPGFNIVDFDGQSSGSDGGGSGSGDGYGGGSGSGDGYGGGSGSGDGYGGGSGGWDGYGGASADFRLPTSTTEVGFMDIGAFELVPEISASASASMLNEGPAGTTNSVSFIVTRDGHLGSEVTVNYHIASRGQSGAAPADFQGGQMIAGQLYFSPYETQKQVFVTVNGDDAVEPDEVFTLELTDASRGAFIATPRTEVTIVNDDSATISITALDVQEGSPVEFVLTLQNDVEGGITLPYSIADVETSASDWAYVDDRIVRFEGKAGETVRVVISTIDDANVETDERLSFVPGAPSNFRSDASTINIFDPLQVTIEDNDRIRLVVNSTVWIEPDAGLEYAQVEIELRNATEMPFSINASASDALDSNGQPLENAATAGVDFQNATQSLHFEGLRGERQTFNVPIYGDITNEPHEIIDILLSESGLSVFDGQFDFENGSLTIANDEAPGLILRPVYTTDSPSAFDPTATTITRSVQATLVSPLGPINVVLATMFDPNGLSDSPGARDIVYREQQIAFSGSDGETRIFEFDVIVDDIVERDDLWFVGAPPQLNPGLANYAVIDAQVVIRKDDTPIILVAASDANEGDAELKFDFTLQNHVVFPFDTVATAYLAGHTDSDDATPTSETLRFSGSAGEQRSLQVPVHDDTESERTERVYAQWTATDPAIAGGHQSNGGAIGNIADNEYPDFDAFAFSTDDDCYAWLPYGGVFFVESPNGEVQSIFPDLFPNRDSLPVPMSIGDSNSGIFSGWDAGRDSAGSGLGTNYDPLNQSWIALALDPRGDMQSFLNAQQNPLACGPSELEGSDGGGGGGDDDGDENDDDDDDDDDPLHNSKTGHSKWSVNLHESLRFNPFPTLNYQRGSNFKLALNGGMPANGNSYRMLDYGVPVELKYGTITLVDHFMVEYTPHANLQSRSQPEDRLLPEFDAKNSVVRFSGNDAFEIHAIPTVTPNGASITDDFIAAHSTVVEIAVSNSMPILPGDLRHEYTENAARLDGPIFADFGKTYRIDLQDLFVDPDFDLDGLKIKDIIYNGEPLNSSTDNPLFVDPLKDQIKVVVGKLNYPGVPVLKHVVITRVPGTSIIEIQNEVTQQDAQNVLFSSTEYPSRLSLEVEVDTGQKTGGSTADGENYIFDLNLDISVVNARGFHLDVGRRLVGFDLPLRRLPWYDDLIWAWPSSGES